MALRIGFVGVAHLHVISYVQVLRERAELVGVWDEDSGRAARFGRDHRLAPYDHLPDLLDRSDAVVICSENMRHADHVRHAAKLGRHILCEKPIAATEAHAEAIEAVVRESGVVFMTAFPCPYSPAFASLLDRRERLGKILAVASTNHGSCPFGWFVEPRLSGGGAMIDHTVHVADLLRRLLRSEVKRVHAVTGHNMYGQEWDDTAMLTLEFESGAFATLDASWSRPPSYKTWGDVTLHVVGENGVAEADLFGAGVDHHAERTARHHLLGYGSNLDALMVDEFLAAVEAGRNPRTSLADGLAAARITLAAYQSSRLGQPVAVA